jgi:peroxiredoxin
MAARISLILTVVFASGFVASLAWWWVDAQKPGSSGPPILSGPIVADPHYVTPEMRRESEAMADRPAPPFSAISDGGRRIDSASIVGRRPVVLGFIQDGCPCSTAAEPFFADLHRAYGDGATFLGVIDGDRKVASRWVAEHRTPFPVLADPDLAIIRAFGARNSAYLALIDPEGRIDGLWPGFSESILLEISGRLAALLVRPEADISAAEAPELPYSGCPFPIDDE